MTWFTEALTWRHGPWSFTLRGDEIADIAFNDRRVLRSVRVVVRDRNWDTARLVVDHVRDSGSTLTLHVRSDDLGSSLRGVVRVEARGHRLVVSTDLESEREFITNRTGLVVLHATQLAGEPLRVTHADGSIEESAFPRAISPHQPVFDISQLSWLNTGSRVALGFGGDVFEMEDQRNWSDASYKTYSRPLSLPFPYTIAAGERVRQSLVIDAREVAVSAPTVDPDLIHLDAGGPMFELALGASTAPDPAPAVPTRPAAMLVELDLRTASWPAALDRAATSGVHLDVRVVATADAPFNDLAAALTHVAENPGIARVGVFEADLHVTDAATLAALRRALNIAGLVLPIVAGSRAHFTELNRQWDIIPRDVAGIAFGVTPLFHSLGTEQLVESIAVQRTIARQAVEMAGGVPVHVGPVTLRPRYNNVATTPQALPTRADLAEGYATEFTGTADARQSSPELAAWTIASAAALAIGGVASVTYFEEWGPRGIRSLDGQPLPVFSAIAALEELHASGVQILSGDSPDGLIWAVGARTAAGDMAFVANLDRTSRQVTVTTGRSSAVVELSAMTFRRVDFARQ